MPGQMPWPALGCSWVQKGASPPSSQKKCLPF
ncbi:hypothetical protein Taro_041150 [Colocasia esculenta]|uniref:Uncharacterized protein n=1 Tax=Colocasia esculenta TaxID=4460 RepID=A0A843WKT3_COLES|nr:hypothetical protein [Colocasia esculenta]